jgi:excisionase family DNA binding protein
MKTLLKEQLRWVEQRYALQDIIDISPDDDLEAVIVDDVVKEAARRGKAEIVRAGQALKNPTLEEVRLFLTEAIASSKSDYLTVKEAAGHLGIALRTVYALCRSGELRHQRYGKGRGTIRITREALDDYRKANAVQFMDRLII